MIQRDGERTAVQHVRGDRGEMVREARDTRGRARPLISWHGSQAQPLSSLPTSCEQRMFVDGGRNMAETLRFIELRCADCGHTGKRTGAQLEADLGEAPTLPNVLSLYRYFVCRCKSRNLYVSGDRGNVILDPYKIQYCKHPGCENPISLPYLALHPKVDRCQICAAEPTVSLPAPPIPPLRPTPQTLAPNLQPLWAALKAKRLELSRQEGKAAFHIFYDTVLMDICRNRPRNLAEMGEVYGVGLDKLDRYGKIFLEVIRSVRLNDD